MPIKLNGTTFNNGGTVTFNGSTVKEIKFGTTTVWKAETTIYPGATVSNLTANSGTYSTANFLTQISSGTTNTNSTVLYVSANLTNYSTLTITGTFSVTSVAGYTGCWISSSSQWSSYRGYLKYPYYTIGQGASSTYYVLSNRINNTTGSRTSITFDVSSLSGTHYICIGCYYNTTTSGGTAKAQITGITAQ